MAVVTVSIVVEDWAVGADDGLDGRVAVGSVATVVMPFGFSGDFGSFNLGEGKKSSSEEEFHCSIRVNLKLSGFALLIRPGVAL